MTDPNQEPQDGLEIDDDEAVDELPDQSDKDDDDD